MPSHHLSASGMERARSCLWWARADVPLPPDDAGVEAKIGTLTHAMIARTLVGPMIVDEVPIAAAGLMPSEEEQAIRLHEIWAAEWYEQHEGEPWEAEVALAFDPATGEVARFTPGTHRDYSMVPDNFIPMTADAIRGDEPGLVRVIDWKTGRGHVTPAVRNAQLATIALAVSRFYGADRATVSIAKIGEGVHEDAAELDVLDLSDWQDFLADRLRALPTSEPVPGPHCRDTFCPQFGRCPATSHALAEASPDVVAVAQRRLPIVTDAADIQGPEHARHQYDVLRAAKARIDAAWEALRRYADTAGGVPLASGKTWIRSVRTVERIDLAVPGAVDVLQRELGERWRAAVEFDTTKAGVERAARLVAMDRGNKRGVIGEVKEATLAALRAAGAITKITTTVYDESSAKEPDHG